MTIEQIKKIEKIRNQYESPEISDFDRLKRLDKKIKRPVTAFSYLFGSIGALVLGTGMCLAMKVIGSMMPLGVAVGVVGIALVSLTYPLHRKILAYRKRKYANEIFALADSLMPQDPFAKQP